MLQKRDSFKNHSYNSTKYNLIKTKLSIFIIWLLASRSPIHLAERKANLFNNYTVFKILFKI